MNTYCTVYLTFKPVCSPLEVSQKTPFVAEEGLMMYHEADLDGVRYIILHDKGDADDDAVEASTRFCSSNIHFV